MTGINEETWQSIKYQSSSTAFFCHSVFFFQMVAKLMGFIDATRAQEEIKTWFYLLFEQEI